MGIAYLSVMDANIKQDKNMQTRIVKLIQCSCGALIKKRKYYEHQMSLSHGEHKEIGYIKIKEIKHG